MNQASIYCPKFTHIWDNQPHSHHFTEEPLFVQFSGFLPKIHLPCENLAATTLTPAIPLYGGETVHEDETSFLQETRKPIPLEDLSDGRAFQRLDPPARRWCQ